MLSFSLHRQHQILLVATRNSPLFHSHYYQIMIYTTASGTML
jgi:hypothetical protein